MAPERVCGSSGLELQGLVVGRSMIRERQRDGIALARARGVYQGRKRKVTDDQVQDARDQIASGTPKAAVARALGCSRRVLCDALDGQGADRVYPDAGPAGSF